MKNKSINKKRKNNKTKKIKIKGGGRNVNYIISSHGSTEGVRGKTSVYRNMSLYTYVDYGSILPIECGFALQTYLTRHRGSGAPPACSKPPYISPTMLNARIYVEHGDPWKSGIIDVTELGKPRVVQTWTPKDSSYNHGYTLNDALATIISDFKSMYDQSRDTLKVHILTCL